MLRKRSRPISKEALMADYCSIQSPTNKYTKPTSFPRLFTGLTLKNFSETTEAAMSPTSILDGKPFSGLKNPFYPDPNPAAAAPKSVEPESRRLWDKLDAKGIGLGIVDALIDEKTESNLPKPDSRMVLFGSQLKIHIPIPPLLISFPSPAESPKSPADFGIKTRNSQIGSFSSGLSPSPVKKSAFASDNSGMETPNSPEIFTGCLSGSEMELSEDYTCVIFHGPNPRTTHIFDNCIIESCCGIINDSPSRKQNHGISNDGLSFQSENFLSFCYACKKNLGPGKDIFMYRGEKAFCSRECRYQEMLLEEEGIDDDIYGAYC